jgi:hypothetical protein
VQSFAFFYQSAKVDIFLKFTKEKIFYLFEVLSGIACNDLGLGGRRGFPRHLPAKV